MEIPNQNRRMFHEKFRSKKLKFFLEAEEELELLLVLVVWAEFDT
jgi:hypothetical protein